jgi:hypothetical protein
MEGGPGAAHRRSSSSGCIISLVDVDFKTIKLV